MNSSNYNTLSSNLNPHLQFSSALNISLHNLKKPDLREIGHDLKISSNYLNLNKGALVDKIIQTIFSHPLFASFFNRNDLSPFDHCPVLHKILSEALKKVTLSGPAFHPMMPQPLEQLYAHQPTIIAQPLFRTTTSNYFPEIVQAVQNQAHAGHFNNQHFGALQQNICLSSSLMCKTNRQSNLLSCIMPECTRKFHTDCLKMPEKEVEKEAKTFECPQCVLEKNDPLSEIKNILLPPFIVNSSEQKQFIMNNYELKAINDDPNLGIEIKCIKLDYKYLNEHTWLDSGELFLNNRKIQEFKPLQINSALKKRKDEKCFHRENLTSINTIKFLDFKPSFDQKVNVRYDDSAVYMAAVYLVKRLRAEELISKIQKTSVKEAESCKIQILSKFEPSVHDDCKISVDKVSVSLMDTFFDKQMIQTPAKTVFCNHLQCFSLENLIRAMEIAIPRKWRCPICKVKAFDLMIDGYLWNIIKGLGKNVCASEVIFSEDGSYEVIKTENDATNDVEDQIKTPEAEMKKIEEPTKKPDFFKKNSNKQEIIILDEDDDVSGETLTSGPKAIHENHGQGIERIISEERADLIKSGELREEEKVNPEKNIVENVDNLVESRELNNNNESIDKNNDNQGVEVEVSVNLTHTDEMGLNDLNTNIINTSVEVDKLPDESQERPLINKEPNSNNQTMEIEHEENQKMNYLASPKSVTSIKSIENIQKGVKEIQITAIHIDDTPNFIKKSERNLAELQQNPNIRIYNLEDLPMIFQKPPEETKEIKPTKRKMETIDQEFKDKIQTLIQNKTVKKAQNFQEFNSNTEALKEEEKEKEKETPQSINLANNLKTRGFIVKLYKKHFPEISKETLNKLASLNPANQMMEMSFQSNNSMMKPPTPASLNPNFNLMGNSFEMPTSSIFPLAMFANGEKSILGNSNNYLNFTMNPHNAMSLFDQNNGFNNDFASQTHVMKTMNNSFLNKANNQITNLMKPGNEGMGIAGKLNRKRINVVEVQKINELKNKGFESNPICLDD